MQQEKSSEVQKWIYEINQYDRRMDAWRKRCRKILKRYTDERSGVAEDRTTRYNALWANVQTILPAVYAQIPKPEIDRRYKDHDDIARVASEVLQRCASFTLADTNCDAPFRQSVFDYLITARGVLWARYNPHFRDIAPEITDDQAEDYEPVQEVTWEEVLTDYVHWEDFGHSDGRTWEEIPAVWRRAFLTKNQLKERFGEELANEIPLNYTPRDSNEDETNQNALDGASKREKKAIVYEIWDKSKREALWLCKDYHEMLDIRDDPLNLRNFFPCPKPLFGTITNDKLEPIPDYILYQDQAMQLDELTSRITSLVKSLKMAGVYDAAAQGVERLLNEGVENVLIPVESWAMFAEKGGLKGAVDWLPMVDVAEVVGKLYEVREHVKQDMYEITGISDLLRGNTDAEETATAQGIKAGYASMRFADRRKEVQRFLRDHLQIVVEIIAEHFSPETLEQMSGIKLFQTAMAKQQAQMQFSSQQPQPGMPPQPVQSPSEEILEMLNNPTWEEVMQLIKSDVSRNFRIDIETDSVIRADEQAERADRLLFLEQSGKFLEKAVQAAQQAPQLAPLLGQMMLFGVRAFRVGRQLEGDFEQAIEAMRKSAANPPPQKPDPEMAKIQAQAQAENQQMQLKAQLDQQIEQGRQQFEMAKLNLQAQLDEKRTQLDAQLAQIQQAAQQHQTEQQNQIEAQRDQLKAHLDAQAEQFRASMETQAQSIQHQFDLLITRLNNAAKVEVAEIAAQTTLDAAQISAASAGSDSGE